MKIGPQVAPEVAPKWPHGSNQAASESNIRKVGKLPTRTDRPSSYGVRWSSDAGRRKEYFKTEKARDDRFDDLVKKAKKGNLHHELPREERVAWAAFKTAIGDTPWQDVVAGWRQHLKSTGRSTSKLTVAEAAKSYLESVEKRQEDERNRTSQGYYAHAKQKVGLFAESFGANKLADMKSEDIEEWVEDLGFDANGTFNNYVKQVRRFFDHFRKELETNPCADIKARDENIDSVGILTVQQTAQVFNYALKHRKSALGRLALEAFAGLRFSSAFRLEKGDINFSDKGITLPAHKHKVGRRFYVDGLPDNLWEWLSVTNDGCWAMKGSDWMHTKSRLFVDAKVDHPRNCLRHSFCTYHVAAFKDPGLTAVLLTHRNQQKLWSNYNGRATQADGKMYFSITPATAASLAALKAA